MRGLLFIFLMVLAISCNYNITKNYTSDKYVSQEPVFCDPYLQHDKDLVGLNYEYLGTIKLDEVYGIMANCQQEDAYKILREEACKMGANFIDIIQEAGPNLNSTCYKCIANFYEIEITPRSSKVIQNQIRDKISYKQKNKLEWDDFKGVMDDTTQAPYLYYSTIKLKSTKQSFFTGVPKAFKTKSVFYRDVSSVKGSFKDTANLSHIQNLYDIGHMYASELENFLNSDEVNIRSYREIKGVLQVFLKEMYKEQSKYIEETNYGKNQRAQRRWDKMINRNNLDPMEDFNLK